MEKVNVYDWDKTIFPVDSTAAFYGWCVRCFPKVLLALPATAAILPKYWAKKVHQDTRQGAVLRFFEVCARH